MKKFFLPMFVLPVAIISCDNATGILSPSNTDTTHEVIQNTANPVAQPSLTQEELKDDTIFAGVKTADWPVAGIKDVKGFKLFVKQLQHWIATENKEEISKVILYPVSVTIDDAKKLIAAYDKVFTKEVKDAVRNTKVNHIFRNYRGAVIGDGKMWITQMGEKFKIIAINPKNRTDWGLMP